LPFSGDGIASQQPAVYRITATPDQICFRFLGARFKSQGPALTSNYGDPIVAGDEPRSGDYLTAYYKQQRSWFLVPVTCPCS
jgi:hypothetical protein